MWVAQEMTTFYEKKLGLCYPGIDDCVLKIFQIAFVSTFSVGKREPREKAFLKAAVIYFKRHVSVLPFPIHVLL
jgi:hypothetical protein